MPFTNKDIYINTLPLEKQNLKIKYFFPMKSPGQEPLTLILFCSCFSHFITLKIFVMGLPSLLYL